MSDQKRYALHISIYEVDEDGDFAEREFEGVTLDNCTTDSEALEVMMGELYTIGEKLFVRHIPNTTVTPRRPEDEEWDGEEELEVESV
jgi:hypothetical protein